MPGWQPDLPAQVERGKFAPLLSWMHEKVHKQGRKYRPAELVERITGGPIRTEPFLSYIREKYGELYTLGG